MAISPTNSTRGFKPFSDQNESRCKILMDEELCFVEDSNLKSNWTESLLKNPNWRAYEHGEFFMKNHIWRVSEEFCHEAIRSVTVSNVGSVPCWEPAASPAGRQRLSARYSVETTTSNSHRTRTARHRNKARSENKMKIKINTFLGEFFLC